MRSTPKAGQDVQQARACIPDQREYLPWQDKDKLGTADVGMDGPGRDMHILTYYHRYNSEAIVHQLQMKGVEYYADDGFKVTRPPGRHMGALEDEYILQRMRYFIYTTKREKRLK